LEITVPGLRPATLLVVITSVITGANFFTEPYLLTGGGGPDNQSVSPVFLIYRFGIEQNHPGYAAAIGILLATGVMVISAVNRFVLEKE
jgi:multiple sugar transport system permease protein